MKPPRLAIILPTFNAAKTIDSCLASIVAQRERDVEVLVLDRLSSDGTMAIVDAYCRRFAFIRAISEDDAGTYDAMNKGVARTTADWLYFIGADDTLFDAETLAGIGRHFDADVDFLYGNILRMTTGCVEGSAYDDDRLFADNICHQAIFYRRELFVRLGGFNLAYRVCADWDFNIRCFGSGCRSRHVPLTICRYGGAGFSSTTTDHVFLNDKLRAIAAAYGVSFWNRRFRSSRHAFFEAAVAARRRGNWGRAAWSYLVYAVHGVLAGEAVEKAVRRLRLALGAVR